MKPEDDHDPKTDIETPEQINSNENGQLPMNNSAVGNGQPPATTANP